MFKSEIIVTDSLGAATSLDLNDELPISLNFNIADVKDPSKRDGSYSKTVKLYGTKTNNKFFEFMFEVNIATNKFNPNLKTPCVIYSDGYIVLEGDLRLMNIQKIYKNGTEQIVYDCVIIGQNSTIFTAISENKLEDLDFSIYDHTFDYAHLISSWTNYCKVSGFYVNMGSNGSGYRYPLINYGFNNFVANVFDVAWLRPALFAKEYWDKIFTAAGKTYTSSFLTDPMKPFMKLLIPNNSEYLTLTAAAKANFEFYAGDNGAGTALNGALTPSVTSWINSVWSSGVGNFKFNNDSTGGFSDPGNVYNPSTGIFTVGANGNYVLSTTLAVQIKYNYPATATSNDTQYHQYNFDLQKSTDGGVTWVSVNYGGYSSPVNITNVYSTSTYNISYPSLYMSIGEKFKIVVYYGQTPALLINFYDTFLNLVTTGTASFDIRLASTSTLKATLVDTKLVEGQPLDINSTIPRDIKQKDFLMSIIRMFNLYITVDKENPDNYIIEPRDDFYELGEVLDWTTKWAIDKPTDIKPMGEIDAKEFIWTYKKDEDWLNKDYFDNYVEVYGTNKEIITNDFLKNTNKTEIIFSPSPVVDNPSNQLIIPYIFDYDGTTVKPKKHNIRCLLWNGLRYITGTYVMNSTGFGPVGLSYYPNVGMVNNALAPTESIEFGVPSKVYYSTPLYTANNLFNRYYSRMLNEVTDRDSKIVVMYLYLTALDIATFKFENTVFIDDTYYLVNKIIDFNPLVDGLTKVELLKLKQYQSYTSEASETAFTLTTNSGEVMSLAPFGESSNSNRIGQAGNQMAGTNISSRSAGSILSGANISIAESCFKINVVSSTNVVVDNNVSGFSATNCSGIVHGASGYANTLVNCNNLRIEPSVFSYVGFKVSNKTVTQLDSDKIEFGQPVLAGITDRDVYSTTNITTSTSYDTYYIDASGGAVTVTLTHGIQVVNIKKIDSSGNAVTIQTDNPGIYLIDGAVTQTISTQWNSYTIGYSPVLTNFYIK